MMDSLTLVIQRNNNYSNRAITVALLILYSVFILVYIPFCCYCSYRLYALRNESYVKIRKSILSQIIIAVFVIFIFQRLILADLLCFVWDKCVDFSMNDG
eukprot:882873_1